MQNRYKLFTSKECVQSLFPHLIGAPLLVDLSTGSPFVEGMDLYNQAVLQQRIEQSMRDGNFSWGISLYLEDRMSLLSGCPQMVQEGRFFHLGLDIIVPVHTQLHAPLQAVVKESGYEAGTGNYGGFVLLEHTLSGGEVFYSLYGHLAKDSLPTLGTHLKAGDVFARIGDYHENGGWFHHTHVQVITQKGLDQGYLSKGYCTNTMLAEIDALCPSPYGSP